MRVCVCLSVCVCVLDGRTLLSHCQVFMVKFAYNNNIFFDTDRARWLRPLGEHSALRGIGFMGLFIYKYIADTSFVMISCVDAGGFVSTLFVCARMHACLYTCVFFLALDTNKQGCRQGGQLAWVPLC